MSRNMHNKMNMGYAAFAFAGALFACSGIVVAQQKNVDTIQVNVVTRYKPTIHNTGKIDTNPATADTIRISRKVKYDMLNTQYPTSYTPPQISALQIKDAPPEPLYHSLLNAGLGNYNTLYAEYFFNSLRSNNTDYGIHLNHFSSVYNTNGAISNFAFNDIDGYWQHFFNQHTFTLDAGFDNHILHDYGYNTTLYPLMPENMTRQRYDLYKGSFDYASAYRDSAKINHDIKLSYYNFNGIDPFYSSPSENNIKGDMRFFTYFIQQRIDLKVSAEYNSYSAENPALANSESPISPLQTFNTTNILFNPYFTTTEKHWDAHLGLNAYYASYQQNNVSNNINVYPDLTARYHIADDVVMIYAGIDGNQTINTYKSLTDENPFVQTYLPTYYTYTKYHVFAGFAGNITRQITYNISGAQSMLNSMPLFVTDTLEQLRNRFDVVYDNVKVTNMHADVDYKWNNKLNVILAGDYNIYTPTNQLKAWYNPALKISATGRYTFQDKYIFKAEFFVVGSQYAPEMVDGVMTAKTLSGYPDLNLGVEYKYNKVFTAFLNLNNIANVAYYTWDNYEMERFNLLLGIRFGF